MESLINRLSEQPALAALMIALLGAALFFVLRKLTTLATLFAVGFIAFVGYFALTGKEPPKGLEAITDKVAETAKDAKEKVKEVNEKIGEDLKEAAKAGVKDALEE